MKSQTRNSAHPIQKYTDLRFGTAVQMVGLCDEIYSACRQYRGKYCRPIHSSLLYSRYDLEQGLQSLRQVGLVLSQKELAQ